MKKIITLILLFFAVYTYAQNNPKKYYFYVNKAELAICNNKLKNAAKHYEKAFSFLEYPFAKDINNAFKCEYYSRVNHNNMMSYTSLLYKKGQFKDDPDSSSIFYDSFMKIKDTLQRGHLYKPELVFSIDSLMEIDQKTRRACPAYRDSCVKDIIDSDSLIMNKLVDLHRKYGGINEMNAGRRGINWYEIIHTHHHQWHWYPLRDSLKKEAMNGSFDMRLYAYIEDSYYMQLNSNRINREEVLSQNIYCTEPCMVVSNVMFVLVSEQQKKYYDKVRKSIYLESTDDMIKKIIFQKSKDNDKGFYFYIVMNFMFGSPDENKAKAKEWMKKIDNKEIEGKYYILQ